LFSRHALFHLRLAKLAAVGAVAAFVGVVAPVSSTANSSVACADNPSAVDINSAGGAQAGTARIIGPSTVVNDKVGGRTYQYQVPGVPGVEDYPVPPPGFSPLTATDQELVDHGFPARPAGGPKLAAWTHAMAAWRRAVPQSTLQVPTGAAVRHHPMPPTRERQISSAGGAVANSSSDNWSGYLYYSGGANEWDEIAAEYVEPSTFAASGCPDPSDPTPSNPGQDASIWVGLGTGDSINAPLAQDGTDAYSRCCGIGINQAWWELFPINAAQPLNLVVSPGHTVYTLTEVQPPASSNTCRNPVSFCFVFFVEDEFTGSSVSAAYAYGAAEEAHAEWIVERGGICDSNLSNCGTDYLANFSTVNWTWTDVHDQVYDFDYGLNTTIGPNGIDMYNGSRRLARTGPVNDSTSGFVSYWENCR
jgi:hypothetical protein